MSEILFRGKRMNDGEWVEGSLLKVTINDKTAYLIFGDNFRLVENDVKALSHALIDPDTVGQYIGATDKNGKKIFGGDVVRHGARVWIISYIPKYARFAGTSPKSIMGIFAFQACEVIGNIYDNQETLKGGES